MRQNNDQVETSENTASAVDQQDAAQIAKEFGHAVLQAKFVADKIVGLTSSIERVPHTRWALLIYRSSNGIPLYYVQLAESGRVTSSSLVEGFHHEVTRQVSATCGDLWESAVDDARPPRPYFATKSAAVPQDVALSQEIIAEWTTILNSPAPVDLLDELRSLTAEYKEVHGEGDCEPEEDESPCIDDDKGWGSLTVQEEWYSDSEHAIAEWMSRGGYDIRDTSLDDRFMAWSREAIERANATLIDDDAKGCDESEATFHQMMVDVRPNPPDGIFLEDWFSKRLDSALAAIPEPLRHFLDALADAYELDDFDAVLETLEEAAEDEDKKSPESECSAFSDDEVKRAWEFVKNYRDSIDLLNAASDAADDLLNPVANEVQQCN